MMPLMNTSIAVGHPAMVTTVSGVSAPLECQHSDTVSGLRSQVFGLRIFWVSGLVCITAMISNKNLLKYFSLLMWAHKFIGAFALIFMTFTCLKKNNNNNITIKIQIKNKKLTIYILLSCKTGAAGATEARHHLRLSLQSHSCSLNK